MVTGVDKYEFKLKIDEMKALVSARNYQAAAEIAETVNWRKIRNLNALVLAGEVFEQVGRYEESKEILLMAYDKSPIGRNIIYRLAEIAIRTQRIDEAQEYYDEFVDIAPHDNLKYVLKYKMTAAQGLPYKEQIKILEELKEQEYSEEWAYELAYLYHKDMQPEKCVEACDELILWFGDGIYVEKALELKMHYQPLTKPQDEKYRMFRQKRTGVIEVKPNDFLESGEIVNEAVEIPYVQTNTGQYNTANLQEEIAKGMQQIRSGNKQQANVQAQQQGLQNMQAQQGLQNMQAQQQGLQKMQAQQQGLQNMQLQQQGLRNMQAQQQWQDVQETAVQEPARAMTFEEIQAEWEKTKQAMQEALQEAEAPKTAESKEQSLEKAEQLMQRLLGIVPQLADKLAAQQAEGWEEDTGQEGRQPSGVQYDLEQAGRIVAGMNQLLQEQIDSLQAEKRQTQIPEMHRVSDPTREMPRLPEDLLLGKEIGAIEKEEMDGSSLQNFSLEEEDNPVMNAWKEAPPGISAIDLLQRVQMEKNGVHFSQPQEPVFTELPQEAPFTEQPQNRPLTGTAQPGGLQAEPAVQPDGFAAGTSAMHAQGQGLAAGTGTIQPDGFAAGTMQPDGFAAGTIQPDGPAAGTMQPDDLAAEELAQTEYIAENMVQPEILAAETAQNEDSDWDVKQIEAPASDYLWQPEMPERQQVQRPEMPERQQAQQSEILQGQQVQQSEMLEGQQVQQSEMLERQQVQQPEMPERHSVQQPEPVSRLIQEPEIPVMRQAQEPEVLRQSVQQPEIPVMQQIQEPQIPVRQSIQQIQEPQIPVRQSIQQPEIPVMQQVQGPGISAGQSIQQPEMPVRQPMQPEMPVPEMVRQQAAGSPDEFFQQECTDEPAYIDDPEYKAAYDGGQEHAQDPQINQEMNAQPMYENEQDNLVLAAKPRFLTQAQLQAESAMDGKMNTQTTKDFSSAGFYDNGMQPEGQNLDMMKILTPEQKQIFSYFVPIAGMEAQIYDLIKGVSEHLQYDKHALSGNIIIEGISGSGKTVLIMDIIKALQKEIKRPAGKTGKIDANALNQKDLDVLMEKISGGCLIIESAGKISRETAVKLSRCMENDHMGTLYIIEDTAEGIQKALERDSSFASKFTEKITIPLFSADELVEFGKAYANDLDYDIDEMGVLALYKRISSIQKLDHVTTLTEVKEIVDEAIENAERGVLKKVFGMLTATRANDDNYVILREKDFEE